LKQTENSRYIDWPKVDSFRKYGGIRIEDDIVVTEIGNENLTRYAFAHVS
jgi:Xaa-Pro dipeptidase